ncbi:hypothetical protein P168DRAFT_287776 [Aspergillus campestris IBT 28561]|uniref:Tetratricopeptide repeat domain protein n=1 Tax=Aspergillus campestris (strain IBT 28561) TaxID=1392248 RepID=A0A2I1DBN2_ASPC2|nr:uncharacterized protein P168DRAFT_287776 [Aspergillus campestris IBT 28561]PKY07284.1 hypothetical protein P168DRAFT_287776 [Aspergillus campestris IBT 28561]
MASSVDIFHQWPLHLDPQSKALSLPPSSSTTPSQTEAINEELQNLNQLHRSLLALETGTVPPPPLPVNPKRSAQISKLRESANTAYRKDNFDDAARLYTFAIDMALGRPGWEPVTLAREELAGLYANRAQAYMGMQAWPEGMLDSKCSVESKPIGNVKAWWRGGKCLAEMGRWEEARVLIEKGLEELSGLMQEIEEGLKRSN